MEIAPINLTYTVPYLAPPHHFPPNLDSDKRDVHALLISVSKALF